MTAILNQARNDFDVIVIDTPPVLAVADVVSLLQNVDGVILVAKPGETKVGPFGQAVEQLRATGARILGVVLNDVNPRNLQYGHYFNHYSARYENYYAAGMQPALSGSAKKN
jgi:Mrp family chromosome partitioning ATPase